MVKQFSHKEHKVVQFHLDAPIMKSRFNLFIEKLLLEMPQMIKSDVGFINSDKSNDINTQYVKRHWSSKGTEVIGNRKVNIYETDKDGADKSVAFIDENGYYIGLVEFDFLEDGIQMVYIWQKKPFKDFILNVFLEYLLPKYETILSDKSQTVLAFNFYNKLRYFLPNNIIFSILDKKNKTEILVDPNENLEKYYGEDEDFENYVFKISKK